MALEIWGFGGEILKIFLGPKWGHIRKSLGATELLYVVICVMAETKQTWKGKKQRPPNWDSEWKQRQLDREWYTLPMASRHTIMAEDRQKVWKNFVESNWTPSRSFKFQAPKCQNAKFKPSCSQLNSFDQDDLNEWESFTDSLWHAHAHTYFTASLSRLYPLLNTLGFFYFSLPLAHSSLLLLGFLWMKIVSGIFQSGDWKNPSIQTLRKHACRTSASKRSHTHTDTHTRPFPQKGGLRL